MNPIKKLFLNDKVIFGLISINALVIFMQGFTTLPFRDTLLLTDNVLSILFLVEMITKMSHVGFKAYMGSSWNRFDFLLVILSIPSILLLFVNLENFIDLGILLIFRVFRVFKFFRFIQFFPQVDHIFRSVQKAMKTTIMVLAGFFVVIFIMAILCCSFFQGINEEVDKMFGNPLTAYFTTFQVFTVEGWNSIPSELCDKANFGETTSFFVKSFFAFLFIFGGVIGLSIVNSLFVDAMINDDASEEAADKMEERTENIEERTEEIEVMTEEIEEKTDKIEGYILQLQAQIQALAQEIQSLKKNN